MKPEGTFYSDEYWDGRDSFYRFTLCPVHRMELDESGECMIVGEDRVDWHRPFVDGTIAEPVIGALVAVSNGPAVAGVWVPAKVVGVNHDPSGRVDMVWITPTVRNPFMVMGYQYPVAPDRITRRQLEPGTVTL